MGSAGFGPEEAQVSCRWLGQGTKGPSASSVLTPHRGRPESRPPSTSVPWSRLEQVLVLRCGEWAVAVRVACRHALVCLGDRVGGLFLSALCPWEPLGHSSVNVGCSRQSWREADLTCSSREFFREGIGSKASWTSYPPLPRLDRVSLWVQGAQMKRLGGRVGFQSVESLCDHVAEVSSVAAYVVASFPGAGPIPGACNGVRLLLTTAPHSM